MFIQAEAKKPISKQKNVQNFADVLRCKTTHSNQFFMIVILSAVALPIVPKVEFDFEAIMYITTFVSKVQDAALSQ